MGSPTRERACAFHERVTRDIPDVNAAFTDYPFLWGLTDDLGPEDEVVDGRCELFTERKPSGFEQFA